MDLRRVFPNASKSFVDANARLQDPELERDPENVPAGSDPGKETGPAVHILRYTSYRRVLLDPENLCTKFLTDALRYCGAIRDDTSAEIELQLSQQKVDQENQEKTLIELF